MIAICSLVPYFKDCHFNNIELKPPKTKKKKERKQKKLSPFPHVLKETGILPNVKWTHTCTHCKNTSCTFVFYCLSFKNTTVQ